MHCFWMLMFRYTVASFGTLLHDKIFSLTFPLLLTTSLTFPWHVSNSLTFPGFPDKWSPWAKLSSSYNKCTVCKRQQPSCRREIFSLCSCRREDDRKTSSLLAPRPAYDSAACPVSRRSSLSGQTVTAFRQHYAVITAAMMTMKTVMQMNWNLQILCK